MILRAAGVASVVAVLALGAGAAAGQEFPEKPIRMIVPFAPGGNTDILARAVAQRMNEHWGKPIVVDNRPGGSGFIAAEIVRRATPDGHTILVGSTAELAVNPSLFKEMPYDPDRDFVPISLGTISPLLVAAHPSFGPGTIMELIDLARAKPKSLSYASVGVGSPMHLSGELFKMMTKTDVVHVPYKGGAPATAALLGGVEVNFGFVGMGPAIPHVRSGRLKALAITTPKRSSLLPEVATMQEQGLKDFNTSIWFAFVAPLGTPKQVLAKLNAEINRVLTMSEVVQYLSNTGVEIAPGTAEELSHFIKVEREKYRKVIQVAGVKLN